MPEAPAATTEAVLIGRARKLADRSTADDATATTTVEVLVCRVRNERYAVELGLLASVQRSSGLTRVPCTSASIAGILNVRGELLTVLDLSVALGGSPLPAETAQVVLVEMPHARVGLLVEEVLQVRRLDLNCLDSPLSGAAYSRGVADGCIVLLDLDQLLNVDSFEDFTPDI